MEAGRKEEVVVPFLPNLFNLFAELSILGQVVNTGRVPRYTSTGRTGTSFKMGRTVSSICQSLDEEAVTVFI